MLEYKQGANARTHVLLTDATTGAALAGVAAATCYVKKADGTVVQVVLDGTNFAEVTGGNFSGTGLYDVILPASVMDQPGPLAMCVSAAGADSFVGVLKVIAAEIAEAKASADANGTAIAALATPTNVTDARDAVITALTGDADIDTAAAESTAAHAAAEAAKTAAEAAEAAAAKPSGGYVHLG